MKTKVLLTLLATLTCASFVATTAHAQEENDDDDYPTENMSNPVIDGTVITDGVPANSDFPAAPNPDAPPQSAPIREYYGPSSLPTLPTVAQLIAGIANAEQTNNANDLVYAYGEAVRNPSLARGALTRLMYDYYRMRVAAGTSEQAIQAVNEASLRFQVFQSAQLTAATQQSQKLVDQNEQIIRQNQQIIQLLQQLAAKK